MRKNADGPTFQRLSGAASTSDQFVAKANTPEELRDLVEKLPMEPGVYIMRDSEGRIVYVGKAQRLRNRVRQYFNGQDNRTFVPLLEQLLGDIETVVTSNSKEALLLENNLIKKHRPRFNVKLRDDKQYLVLRLDPQASWPRLELVRNIKQDGCHYFGPYHSAASARSTLRVINRHFQLRTCSDYVLRRRKRPCLQYQINRCPAPCVLEVDPRDYNQQVHDVALFLKGRHHELLRNLQKRMEDAATSLEFETAARLRDQLKAIETTLANQRMVSKESVDQDFFGMYRQGGQIEFVIMQIREGKLASTQAFSDSGMELPDADLMAGFLSAYYERATSIPDEISLPLELAEDDSEPLQQWLSELRGRKVNVRTPERGDRHKLVQLATRNAGSNFVSRRDQKGDVESILSRTQARLKLNRLPRKIECYDISHIQGSDTVASMVVFSEGQANKSCYRSFKIKGIDGLRQQDRQNDDFASMYEVLSRRFRRALDDEDESWSLPDLIVIDGGKGQLGRVLAAMQDMGIPHGPEGVDIIALAKERKNALGYGKKALRQLAKQSTASVQDRGPNQDQDHGRARSDEMSDHQDSAKKTKLPDSLPSELNDQSEALIKPGQSYVEHVLREADETPDSDEDYVVLPERVFLPGVREPIRLRQGSSELYLLTAIRDEAHRFAITHHRKKRGKRSLQSALDDIPGVGPAMKKKLLVHFGSMSAIRSASVDDLLRVKGVGQSLALKIRESL